jgi:hypothetical protein
MRMMYARGAAGKRRWMMQESRDVKGEVAIAGDGGDGGDGDDGGCVDDGWLECLTNRICRRAVRTTRG